jgi:ABC-type transport system involved in multi-copper enzyme maturation permease subunit
VRLLGAELLKLRTTRVPYVFGGVIALLAGITSAGFVGGDALGDDPALDLVQGASFAATFVTVVGILLVTNEYRHGTIASTFLVEPHRERVLVGKLAAALMAGALYSAVAVTTIAAVALPWLAARGEALPLGAQTLEAVGLLFVSFMLSAALGASVGAIIRNQVGAIVATLLWFLALEPLVALLAALLQGGISDQAAITEYLPGAALSAIVGGAGGNGGLRIGPAIALSSAYVVALAVVGALAMVRRDP